MDRMKGSDVLQCRDSVRTATYLFAMFIIGCKRVAVNGLFDFTLAQVLRQAEACGRAATRANA